MTERMEHQILTALESGDDFVPKALFAALWGEYREREAECARLAGKCVDLAKGDSACRCRPTDADIERGMVDPDTHSNLDPRNRIASRRWVCDLLDARDAVLSAVKYRDGGYVLDAGKAQEAVQDAMTRLRDVRGW